MSGQINRAEQLWINWHQKQQMLEGIFGAGVAPDSKQKFDFLSAGVQRISPTASPDEKLVLALIKAKVGKLEKQLYPNVVFRLLRKVRRLVYDRPLQTARMKALKSENLQALGETLHPLGLDMKKLNLAARLDYERPQVKVELNSHYRNGRELSVTLNLDKDNKQHYQLIGFTASLPDASANHKSISHDFSADSCITVPEAAKLLEGRSVLKTDSGLLGIEQGKWLQLDKGLLNEGKHVLTAFSAGDFALNE